MVYCAYCGKELAEDALFCSNCGERTSKGEETHAPFPRTTRHTLWDGYQAYEAMEERSFTGEVSTERVFLQVDNMNGPVHVASWDKPEYSVQLHVKARGPSQEEADKNLKLFETPLNKEVSDGLTKLVLAYDYPREWGRWYSVDVDVKLPEKSFVDLDLESSNGGIEVSALKGGDMKTRSSNGRLTLQDVTAKTVASKTSNGRIEANVQAEEVTLTTSNGPIEISGFQGKRLEMHTSNGAIHLNDISAQSLTGRTSNGRIEGKLDAGDSSLSTSNGQVDLDFGASRSGRHRLHTSMGSVRLRLPSDTRVGYDLDLHTTGSRIDIDIPNLAFRRSYRDEVLATTTGFDAKEIKLGIEADTSHGRIEVHSTLD